LSEEYGDAFIVALTTHIGNNAWLIELGAFFHMTFNRYWFFKYKDFDGGKV
jgi:hypothetical protein